MTSTIFLRRMRQLRWRLTWEVLYPVAFLWRRLLFRTTFIAVTGSLGKTTAKECLAAMLSSRFATAKNFRNENDFSGVPGNLLRVRPWHRFAVLEVATDRPGFIRRNARLVRPDIALVLSVARTHTKSFKTLEDTAAEKARLLASLRRGGIAVLNGDDARVAAMAKPGRFRVVRFGSSPSFDAWADNVTSNWPEGMSFQAHIGAESRMVRTGLTGTHWWRTVLGAMTVARLCGVSLETAADAVRSVEPVAGRMQRVSLPCGATMIRDEIDNSVDTWGPAFEALERSEARRKLVVLGDQTDSGDRPRKRLRQIGARAARIAGVAIFVGEHSHHAAKAAVQGGIAPENVHRFVSARDAAEFLKAELKPGDVVLVKGGLISEHLARISLAQLGNVTCWKTGCRKAPECDYCREIGPDFAALS